MKSKILMALLILNFVHTVFFKAHAGEVLNFEAHYRIPTLESEDSALAIYQLQNYQVEIFDQKEGKLSILSYVLPTEMIGVPTKIELQLISEHHGFKFLSGENAFAKCTGPWNKMFCEIRFHQLKIDLISIENKLKEVGTSESEIKSRLEILSRFSGDPIGFTSVTN